MNLNQVLHGHYGYYGIAGNFSGLHKVSSLRRTLLAKDAEQSKP
jgi:hypothetical protein